MKVQDLPKTAARGAFSIVTLPVNLARRAGERLRGADAAPKATEPPKPSAAEAPEIVAEETDGIAAAQGATKL